MEPRPHSVAELLADPLATARELARAGSRVVGYVGADVPVALILAAGATPVRLRALAAAPTPGADRYLESAFTPEARSIAEQWLSGALDALDAVVFARTDDASQRLYYYLTELQRRRLCAGPRALLYDIATIGRASSVEHTRDSTRRLAAQLGVQTPALAAAMRRVCARESLLADIRARRRAANPVRGSAAWRLERAAPGDWREVFDDTLRHSLAADPALGPVSRLFLAGDAPPADALHRAAEDAGGSIVGELVESASLAPRNEGESIDALADHHHACRTPAMAMRDDAGCVARRARDSGAHGVVFWLIEENEALPWEVARQRRAVEAAGLPVLLLTRQSWQLEAAADAVRDFVRTLEVTE